MKKMVLLILMAITTNVAFSGEAKDKLEEYFEQKDYNKASKYIPAAYAENRKDYDLLVLCGDIYFELENADSALIMFLKAEDIEDDETNLMRKIAKTYSKLNKVNDAIEWANDAIKEDKDDVYNYLCLGNVYLSADSLKQAELFITKAREINKKVPDAFIALGDLYFAQRVYELAKNNYEEALSIDEENVEARTKLAISYYWLANREYDEDLANELFKKSLQEWNTITKKDSMNARAFFEQGKILFFSKIWDKAAQSLYKYVQLRPSGSLGRWYLAQSLYELAECDSAEPHLTISAQQIDTVKFKAKLLLARCYFDANKYEESIKTYNEIKQTSDLELQDMKRYAGSMFKSGDTLNALEAYEGIIAMDSSECKITFQTGLMYFQLKQYDNAARLFASKNEKCSENFSKTEFYLGMSYLLNEKPDSAIVPFESALELDSTNIRAYIYISDSYAKMENIDSTELYLNMALDQAIADTATYLKDMKTIYQKLCGFYYNVKKIKNLKETAKNWSEYFPEEPLAYLYQGVAYQMGQDIGNACKNYRLVLKYDKDNKIAKDMLSKLTCP